MPYVICEPCVNTKNQACIDVCPVDAIHPVPTEGNFPLVDQLFIDPQTCTNCGLCAAACPVNAIFEEQSVPEEWLDFIDKNRQYFYGP